MIKLFFFSIMIVLFSCKSNDNKATEQSKSITQRLEIPFSDSIAKLYCEAKWVLYNINSCYYLDNNEIELTKGTTPDSFQTYPLVTCDLILGYQKINKDTTILAFSFFKNNSFLEKHKRSLFHTVRFIGSNIVGIGYGDYIELDYKQFNQGDGKCLQYLLTHRDSIDYNPWILKEARLRGIIK